MVAVKKAAIIMVGKARMFPGRPTRNGKEGGYQMIIRKLLSLLLAACLAVGVTACGGGGKPDASKDSSTSTPATENRQYEGKTLNFWSMWSEGEPQAQVIQECADAFEEETGCHVNIEWKGRTLNEILSASLNSEADIDIFEDDYNRIGQVYAQWTADLTDMADAAGYAEHSYPVFNSQSVAWTGTLNAITEQPQVGGIFYDKAAFEKAGISSAPATWSEFLDACQKLKDAGIAPLAQDSAYTDFSFYYHLVRHLGEEGIAELREQGGWADNAKAVQAFQEIIDLQRSGYLAEGAPDEYPASQSKIGFGTAAMVVCAQYVTAEVNRDTGTEVDWGTFNYPAVDGGAAPSAAYMGANSLAITSYSENKQAAFDFCMKLVTGEFDQKMADTCIQIPADPTNTAPAILSGTVETLMAAEQPMSWCGELNTHPAWESMKDLFTQLFEGKYASGAEAAAAMDALHG